MSGKQIPFSWIAERLAAYQSSDSRTRQDSQRELFERLLPRILQSAMAYQRNSTLASCSTHLAEDAAAYVCMMLLRHINRGIAAEDVTATIHHLLQSFFKREIRHRARVLYTDDPMLADGVHHDWVSVLTPVPQLRRAVLALDPDQREALYLRFWKEFSFGAIGELQGVNAEMIRSRELKVLGWLRMALARSGYSSR